MLTLTVPSQDVELPRNIGLLDTNALVAFIDESDRDHENAILVIEDNPDYEWAATLPVVVEACGVLNSRRGFQYVLRLLQWLLTPGTVRLLPGSHPSKQPNEAILDHSNLMSKLIIDYVDAHLMELADTITNCFNLKPHLPIFTFDTRDFIRCANHGKMYSLYDMRGLELIDFQFGA